jgi:hypothetical protein
MTIRYLPRKMLRKMVKKRDMKRLVTGNLTLNKTVVRTLEDTGVLTKKILTDVALKVIKGYKKRYKEELKEGTKDWKAKKEASNNNVLLIQRVENESLQAIANEIKVQYYGEYYEWLPSDSETPDPEHQLNYGKKFKIGKGEMPGERYGCKCGMNILVDETRLNL